MKIIKLDLNDTVDKWHNILLSSEYKCDFLIFSELNENLIWFVSNYTQYIAREGNNEVVPLYGKSIKDLKSFIYQINFSLPVGYLLKTTTDALYDLLLNFETEPLKRFIIWNDASFLYNKNINDFRDIFELLIVSAYCNRNGISTIKPNGEKYLIDQRNIFIFEKNLFKDINDLLQKEYFIPSIFDEGLYKKMEFNIIEFIE